jgi:hypothetical protein
MSGPILTRPPNGGNSRSAISVRRRSEPVEPPFNLAHTKLGNNKVVLS